MNFAIFDEAYYLRKNPDVAAAVRSGIFQSGKQHFQLYGLPEKRTNVSLYWSERSYFGSGFLPNNFDVYQALADNKIPSALSHFIQFGEAEGRVISNSFYNERFYLQQNPDIANAIAAKIFPSGFSHFIQYGIAENRKGSAFNEQVYLSLNPDVDSAVRNGAFLNALEHYKDYGQKELRPAFLSGSNGSDIVSAFDTGKSIIAGVGFDVSLSQNPIPTSFGVGEMDTLVGSNSKDTFILGVGRSSTNPTAQKFYVGQGDADYAVISSFDIDIDVIEPGQDVIQLAGKPEDYLIKKADDSSLTNVYAVNNGNNSQLDLVASVATFNLSVLNVDPINETFTLASSFPLT